MSPAEPGPRRGWTPDRRLSGRREPPPSLLPGCLPGPGDRPACRQEVRVGVIICRQAARCQGSRIAITVWRSPGGPCENHPPAFAGSGGARMTNGSTRSEGRVAPAGANRRDAGVAATLVLLGVAVIGLALRVEPGVQTDPLGPRAFPLALGAAIALCGLLLGVSALARRPVDGFGRDVRRVRRRRRQRGRSALAVAPRRSHRRDRGVPGRLRAPGIPPCHARDTWWRSCCCSRVSARAPS